MRPGPARGIGLVAALIGGMAGSPVSAADPSRAPDPVYDMTAKFVIAETVIGAADGLLGAGWVNGGVEARVDRLRHHPQREAPERYAGVRAAAEGQAKAGLWSEAGLTAYLDVIETPAADLYPVIAATLLAGEGALQGMVETRLWYGGDPDRILAATRLLEIEIATQTRFLDLPAELVWSATPPIDAQEAIRIGLDRLPPGAAHPSGPSDPGL
jgi:hypothetical protein